MPSTVGGQARRQRVSLACLVGCAMLGILLITAAAHGQNRDPWAEARARMVEHEVVAAGVKDARVCDAIRATPRHEFVPAVDAAVRLLRHGDSDRRGPDHLVAVHRGLHDRATTAHADGQGPGDRHRQRIPGGRAQRAGVESLLDRDRRAAGKTGSARRSAGWATKTSRRRSATAIKAGRNTRPSTRSSSLARRRTFPSRWSSNSRRAAGWWFPWENATNRPCTCSRRSMASSKPSLCSRRFSCR